MKRSLTILVFIFLVLLESCKQENQKIEKIEKELSELQSKFYNRIKYQKGLLTKDLQPEDEEYWDIPIDYSEDTIYVAGIHFAYHRKNESEMWQPVQNAYSGYDYIRIPGNYEYKNEEYLVLTLNLLEASIIKNDSINN